MRSMRFLFTNWLEALRDGDEPLVEASACCSCCCSSASCCWCCCCWTAGACIWGKQHSVSEKTAWVNPCITLAVRYKQQLASCLRGIKRPVAGWRDRHLELQSPVETTCWAMCKPMYMVSWSDKELGYCRGRASSPHPRCHKQQALQPLAQPQRPPLWTAMAAARRVFANDEKVATA